MLWHLVALLLMACSGVALARFPGTAGLSGICLMILATALALGASVGFLFAIPRVAGQLEAATLAVKHAEDTGIPEENKAKKRRLLNTNNNLEKVSDWLTTMLVGV